MTTCPRDSSELKPGDEHSIAVERCPTCGGDWYQFAELAQLEASVVKDQDVLAGTIEYGKRESSLACPACGKKMVAFDYRAHNLELDACPDEHGFWLDSGEADRVREIMRERIADLQRSASAEQAWNRDRESGFRGSGLIGRVRNLFRGR
jgi:Zn-finger nucleic acid-binding protein